MYGTAQKIDLTRKLLIALGIEIQPGTNFLIDQETKNQLNFENKSIKANLDPDKALYISDYDIKFDPVDPKCTKIMERMMGKFLDDNSDPEVQNIDEVLTYYFEKMPIDEITHYMLNIKFVDGHMWKGHWFMNKILCYAEAILDIDGTFIDSTYLKDFDLTKDELEEMQY